MNRLSFWQADHLRFLVTGGSTHKFLTGAALRGIHLQAVCPCKGGLTAGAPGRDYRKLQALANSGGWSLTVLTRHGPGKWLERAAERLGLVAGLMLFIMLIGGLSRYVWTIDYGDLEQPQRQSLNLALEQNALLVGSRVSEEKLRAMQKELLLNTGEYGWLSLNFTGGCLYFECTEAEKQQVTAEDVNTALYASDDALILQVENRGGFADVTPGQTVAHGQLLTWAEKRDRSGNAVRQAATGQIIGRVMKTYTATCLFTQRSKALTGRRCVRDSFIFLGRSYEPRRMGTPYPYFEKQLDWEPLSIGRLMLPACICRSTYWEKATVTQTYSKEEAAKKAARDCVRSLLAEYPDAVFEKKRQKITENGTGVCCHLTITFRANIARKEENHTELPPYQEN